MIIGKILAEAIKEEASDVILSPNAYPALKINWEIKKLTNYEVLQIEDLDKEIFKIMTPKQKEKFKENLELDFSVDLQNYSRFRVNISVQRKWMCAVFRPIRNKIPDFNTLHLPEKLLEFTKRKNWLILVTWSVWSGKSTTMASLINYINLNSSKHIVTIEDPIEYMFENEKSIIEQREVWSDTLSYENWLKYSLRQASDVIMLWEMRDLETFRLALRAAETWNLVFATLHTSWAARTIARIIDMFPSEEKWEIKAQLSNSLIWVIWQDLIKQSDEKWRVLAYELLVNNTSIANMIRKEMTHQINWVIETSAKEGMVPMNKSLEALHNKWLISRETLKQNIDSNKV